MAAALFSYFWLAAFSAFGASAGASQRRAVRPAEWGGAALALAGAAVMLGRKRLHQRPSRAAVSGRPKERLAERAWIAQQLDDTLFDRFAGAWAEVQSVADALPADSEAKAPLNQALDVMRRAIEDGRRAVREWRSHQGFRFELAEAFSRIPEETASAECGGQPSFRVLCEGPRKPLEPRIEDEIYRIGREAVLNAFRHSRARNIEVALKFRSDSLRVVVRDDGCGMTPDLVARSRDAHRGLAAMRDKAEKIGARLRLRSAPRRGTELELSVPGVFSIYSPRMAL
jgi:signal transduction histidine kinase